MLFDLTALLVGLTEMMDVRLIKTLQRWPSRVLSCFPCRGLEGRCATRRPVSGLRLHGFPKTRRSASGSTALMGNRMGGLIVALPRKEWGGSEGCSLPVSGSTPLMPSLCTVILHLSDTVHRVGFLALSSEAGHPHRPLIWGTWWGGASPVQSDPSFA